MRIVAQGVLALTVLGFVGCTSATSPDPSNGKAKNAIVYGSPDTTHQAVMFLQYAPPGSQYGAACTATLVATQGTYGFLLTAAHCILGDAQMPINNPQASDFMVVQGNNIQSPSAPVYPVVDFKVDPQNNVMSSGGNLVHDFAVVKIAGVG